MKNKKKKLYCAFIDFAKAFDTVWRKGLWHKLLGNEINGKMYKVILHIVTQRVLNKYQILLRSHQIYNPSHIHSFLQETVGDHLNILRIRKVKKGFLLFVLLYYTMNSHI
jgi:hypothetical protein